MNYAIEILEKEKYFIINALNVWETTQYPEAKKERKKRLKEINEAINVVNNSKPLIDTLTFIKNNPVMDDFTRKLCEEVLKKSI